MWSGRQRNPQCTRSWVGEKPSSLCRRPLFPAVFPDGFKTAGQDHRSPRPRTMNDSGQNGSGPRPQCREWERDHRSNAGFIDRSGHLRCCRSAVGFVQIDREPCGEVGRTSCLAAGCSPSLGCQPAARSVVSSDRRPVGTLAETISARGIRQRWHADRPLAVHPPVAATGVGVAGRN